MGEATAPVDFRSLVDQQYEFLYRYAYHLAGSAADAEDLTQETFCTAQQKLHQLRDSKSARAWLCRILRNHYLRGLRMSLPRPTASIEQLAAETEAAEDLDGDWDAERLHQVLAELPEAFRTPIILFYFEEISYRQIADELGIPIGTVMSRLARAKAYLRSRLCPSATTSGLAVFSQGVS